MSQYILKSNRVKFIEKNFFQWSFNKDDDSIPDIDKFKKLNHPAELFYLASIYNWDDGPSVLEWVIESPLCTKAAANLIFWRAAPDYYMRYELNAVNAETDYDEDYEVLRLLRKIIEKHKNNSFSSFNIAFDPANEVEEIMTKNPKWTVPAALYEKIDGMTVLVENGGKPFDISNIVKVIVALAVIRIIAKHIFN